ncbi:MAG: hypothetical protein DCC68_10865 [Planctomycetota bacterium]|nr:MAG: hypothetical protein DCC68_10865 [Planctomycetota bacterium]
MQRTHIDATKGRDQHAVDFPARLLEVQSDRALSVSTPSLVLQIAVSGRRGSSSSMVVSRTPLGLTYALAYELPIATSCSGESRCTAM